MTFRLGWLEVMRRAALAALVASLLGIGPVPLGASDDFGDLPHISAAVNRALEYERDGTSIPWTNAETGNAGEITVESTFFRDPETPCRNYRRTTERADGSMMEIFGTGCREPRGVWRLTEEPTATAEADDPAPSPSSPPDRRPGEPTSILTTDLPAAGDESGERDGAPDVSEREGPPGAGAPEGDEQAAWVPPVPRPKPQIAVIVTGKPTQSDE